MKATYETKYEDSNRYILEFRTLTPCMKCETTAVLSDITHRHYWISIEESTKIEVSLLKRSPYQDEDVEEKLEQLSIGDSFHVVLKPEDNRHLAWFADSVTIDYRERL